MSANKRNKIKLDFYSWDVFKSDITFIVQKELYDNIKCKQAKQGKFKSGIIFHWSKDNKNISMTCEIKMSQFLENNEQKIAKWNKIRSFPKGYI